VHSWYCSIVTNDVGSNVKHYVGLRLRDLVSLSGPPTLNNFVYRNANFMWTRGRSQGIFQRRNIVSDISETCSRKVSSLFVAFKVVNVTREVIVLLTGVLCWSLSLAT